jgi:hypothetical protein
MNDDQSTDHTGAVLEHIESQLKAILEGQTAMSSVPRDINEIKERLSAVESTVTAIRAAVTDQTRQVNNHETRLTAVEQTV